jgi:aminomethyltransferase
LNTAANLPGGTLWNAINFKKGCYIGQETVARLHFRGHVNRELTGFVLETDSIPDGELTIQHEGKDAGRITSIVKSLGLNRVIGLGYLRVALKKPETPLTVVYGDDVISVSVHDLPFAGNV